MNVWNDGSISTEKCTINYYKLSKLVAKEIWNSYANSNIDDSVETIISEINQLIEILSQTNRNKQKRKEWITMAIIKTSTRLYKEWKNDPKNKYTL